MWPVDSQWSCQTKDIDEEPDILVETERTNYNSNTYLM